MISLPLEIASLSQAEKIDLLDALWENIESEAPSLSQTQQDELDQRLSSYEANPNDVVSWETVRSDVFRTS